MVEAWIEEMKRNCDPNLLGMILTHSGIVRGTAKDGGQVRAMNLSYSEKMLEQAVETFKARAGIADIKVWINAGALQIGDDIMKVCVAGRFRTDVLPVFEELLTLLKTEIVREKEL